jgi:hypothetical protein
VSCPPEGSRVLDVVNPIVDKALAWNINTNIHNMFYYLMPNLT